MNMVTSRATVVSSSVDTMPKYQFWVTSIGCMPAAVSTSLVISVSMLSLGVIRMLAPNAAPTPANAPASPASGCRPTVRKAAAASGTRIRYPASVATEESTPTKMRIAAIQRRGATFTTRRIIAPMRPACSATPTPAIAISTTATTPNPAKLSTNEEKKKRAPSMERRLRTSKVRSSIV